MIETFKFTTTGDYATGLGGFLLYWSTRDKSYTVTHPNIMGVVCKVYPYKGEEGTLSDPSKMFTVKADNYPGVGSLEQMVKGSDLQDYLDSVRLGRGK
jgi:hypothetical protein